MSSRMSSKEPVVILVDNRKRDLDVATLIAFQLRERGVECELAPLEAFRAVLAYRPSMIVFNHLFASHLAGWSQRLHEMGVLTAVLTNEGMLKGGSLKYQSGNYHRNGHVDYFFCWNEHHARAVVEGNVYPDAKVSVIGVPRFDFYFEPWSNVIRSPKDNRTRPQVLVCTNTGIAKFWDLPREYGDKHFLQWSSHIENFGDHWKLVEAQWKARNRFLEFTEVLARSGKFDVVLRPHPSEGSDFYAKWIAGLPEEISRNLSMDAETNISSLILDSDLVVSDESCTTAMESWIARKPTVGIVFDKTPPLYKPERARGHVSCDSPDEIAGEVSKQLSDPSQQRALEAARREILAEWGGSPDGKSTKRIAETIASAVHAKQPGDWSKLTWNDRRRAAKLRLLDAVGAAYHFDPLLSIKKSVLGKRYLIKAHIYDKSIKPRDVRDARLRFEQALNDNTASRANAR
jgi:surface carbohydrate biosynthesis protein